MVFLNEISIEGYKNISRAKLQFGSFNVIVGPNNVGKSNLIQVLDFLNFIINSSNDAVSFWFENGFTPGKHFKRVTPNTAYAFVKGEEKNREGDITFKLVFSNLKTQRIFEYEIVLGWLIETEEFKNINYIKRELLTVKDIGKRGPGQLVFKRSTKKGNEESDVVYGDYLKKTSFVSTIKNSMSVVGVLKLFNPANAPHYSDAISSLDELIKTPIFYFSNLDLSRNHDPIRNYKGKVVSIDLIDKITSLEKTQEWEAFKDALQNVIGIKNILIHEFKSDNDQAGIQSTKVVYFYHRGTFKSLDEFSDGTILIIALIASVIGSQSSIFLIEELENSIHPKALMDLIALFKEYSDDKQFIMTSHSIALVNDLNVEQMIVGEVNEEDMSCFYNVRERAELLKRLKNGYLNYSDEIFFNTEVEEEEEF